MPDAEMSDLAECLKTANRSYEFTLVTFYPFDDDLKRKRKASGGRRCKRNLLEMPSK
jgi:hypothetical protein